MARTANQILETQLGKLLIRLAELESVCEKQAEEIAAMKEAAKQPVRWYVPDTPVVSGGAGVAYNTETGQFEPTGSD